MKIEPHITSYKNNKNMEKLKIFVVFLLISFGISYQGYAAEAAPLSSEFFHVGSEVSPALERELHKVELHKEAINKIKKDLQTRPNKFHTNAMIGYIFIEYVDDFVEIKEVPHLFLSGWNHNSKKLGGKEEELKHFASNLLNIEIEGIAFVGTPYSNIGQYREHLVSFLEDGVARELRNLSLEYEKERGEFYEKYAHTESAFLLYLYHANVLSREEEKPIKSIGVVMLSYFPSCSTCKMLLNREVETRRHLMNKTNYKEDTPVSYFIRVYSFVKE